MPGTTRGQGIGIEMLHSATENYICVLEEQGTKRQLGHIVLVPYKHEDLSSLFRTHAQCGSTWLSSQCRRQREREEHLSGSFINQRSWIGEFQYRLSQNTVCMDGILRSDIQRSCVVSLHTSECINKHAHMCIYIYEKDNLCGPKLS